jgi:hypothetical protein
VFCLAHFVRGKGRSVFAADLFFVAKSNGFRPFSTLIQHFVDAYLLVKKLKYPLISKRDFFPIPGLGLCADKKNVFSEKKSCLMIVLGLILGKEACKSAALRRSVSRHSSIFAKRICVFL